MIEYALLLALIGLAAAAVFPAIGTRINAIFNLANTCLSAAGCPAQ